MRKIKLEINPDEELRDIALCSVSLTARGLWSFMRLIMVKSPRYGSLTLNNAPVTNDQLARMAGSTPEQISALLDELQKAGIVENERGVFISRSMILKESIRQKRAAGGKNGGNPDLKKSTKTRPSKRKDNHTAGSKDNHSTGDGSESAVSHNTGEFSPETKNGPKTLTLEDKQEVNHSTGNPHEQRETTPQNDEETESPPLYILFKIDNYISEKKEKEVWRKKLRKSILNELGPDVREMISKDFELLRAFLDFEEMRNKIKKPMTARAAKNIISKNKLISGGVVETAIAIFDKSINSNWQDIYPLKDGNINPKTTERIGNAGANSQSSGGGITQF